MISELRKLVANLKPSGGIKHVPIYPWKSIFTTNYDNIIEQAYDQHKKKCRVYSSNFDFVIDNDHADCSLFKIHGTIDKDESDGHKSRIIITENDYDQLEQYREYIYDRMKGDLAGADLLIIGHSLADPDMSNVVRRAVSINERNLSPAKITLMLFTVDDYRASIFEQKGLTVTYGGVDDFFLELAKTSDRSPSSKGHDGDPFNQNKRLDAATVEVADLSDPKIADISPMFNGWPANHADIVAGLTFERNICREISDYFEEQGSLCATIIGAAGVGKTTAARQLLQTVRRAHFRCWEHKSDASLVPDDWVEVAANLREKGEVGVLLIDDAHIHLHEFNQLIDKLISDDNGHLKIVAVSTRNYWYPRIKTPNLYRYGREFKLSRLVHEEIERLLNLLDRQPQVRELVEETFSGFNRQERKRRLLTRCEADMFVCLKNIFASEAFDDIVLREYAGLGQADQEIYRNVAAMETAGVRVHRQLVIRLLGLAADSIPKVLENLSEIVDEYSIDERYGIYGWRCRHPVISEIITKYKYKDIDQIIHLFENVIDNISPTYEIEIRTLRELCNLQGGLSRIQDKGVQNRLLRKMISSAPGERVPRHRLIRNLIDLGAFEKADTEIRVFNRDFGTDGPVHRYKIRLMVARAVKTAGILEEDRIAILEKARELAAAGAERYPYNKNILSAYADVGIEYYKKTGNFVFFDEAISLLKAAEDDLGDPDISSIIARLERRIAGQSVELESVLED